MLIDKNQLLLISDQAEKLAKEHSMKILQEVIDTLPKNKDEIVPTDEMCRIILDIAIKYSSAFTVKYVFKMISEITSSDATDII